MPTCFNRHWPRAPSETVDLLEHAQSRNVLFFRCLPTQFLYHALSKSSDCPRSSRKLCTNLCRLYPGKPEKRFYEAMQTRSLEISQECVETPSVLPDCLHGLYQLNSKSRLPRFINLRIYLCMFARRPATINRSTHFHYQHRPIMVAVCETSERWFSFQKHHVFSVAGSFGRNRATSIFSRSLISCRKAQKLEVLLDSGTDVFASCRRLPHMGWFVEHLASRAR
jgi:hypothetical protein